MKCPRCHGTGQVPNRTRYRVEKRDSHMWYPLHYFRMSTTNLKEAIKEYEAFDFVEENAIRGPSPMSGYEITKVRVISISAKGRRRTLMERHDPECSRN